MTTTKSYFNQVLTYKVWTMDWTKSVIISANIVINKATFLLTAKRELETENIQWELSLGSTPKYRL